MSADQPAPGPSFEAQLDPPYRMYLDWLEGNRAGTRYDAYRAGYLSREVEVLKLKVENEKLRADAREVTTYIHRRILGIP